MNFRTFIYIILIITFIGSILSKYVFGIYDLTIITLLIILNEYNQEQISTLQRENQELKHHQ